MFKGRALPASESRAKILFWNFYWNELPNPTFFAQNFYTSSLLTTMQYSGLSKTSLMSGKFQRRKSSFTFFFVIKYLTKRLFSNFAHKLIVDKKACWSISSDVPYQSQSPWAKFCFRFLIEITYITNRFCCKFA